MRREIIVEDKHNPGVYIVKLADDRPSSSGELLGKISKTPNLSDWINFSTNNGDKDNDNSSSEVNAN